MNIMKLQRFYSDQLEEYISEKYKNQAMNWDDIHLIGAPSEDHLLIILRYKAKLRYSEFGIENDISIDTWNRAFESKMAEFQENAVRLWEREGGLVTAGEGLINDFKLIQRPSSAWYGYEKKLRNKEFSDSSIISIRKSTSSLLQRLNSNTPIDKPLRGLIIGNVQSGKTANIAGIIAAAADYGFNMFIILSGMIKSLRQQTEERLKRDLSSNSSNLYWENLSRLSGGLGYKSSDYDFSENSRARYLYVCLKNPSWLNGLIGWLKSDPKQLSNMRILIIDDEADQASVNTKDINKDEATTINKLIKDLVFSRYLTDEEKNNAPAAVNYLAFTATPYANLLNEQGKESLYPEDLIYRLPINEEYFGPFQLFGLSAEFSNEEGEMSEPLDIIRFIPKDQKKVIDEIQNGKMEIIPASLKESLCWFLCCVAAFRHLKIIKPFSMLINISQKVSSHDAMAGAIINWLKKEDIKDIYEQCEKVWRQETARFTKESLQKSMPDYPLSNVDDYPTFLEIAPELKLLLKEKIQRIKVDDYDSLHYGLGIHLCIDNSQHSKVTEDDEYERLLYPNRSNMPSKAPAFLVIGGHTLSRGLTLEGLVSTYFCRPTKIADSLMQMGRWFGYRKGYELYPRIWLTENIYERFQLLALLDEYLRQEVLEMTNKDLMPRDYAVKIKNFPSSILQITSKKKMQSAIYTDDNFSGMEKQTQLFDTDVKIQKENLELTSEFLSTLGLPDSLKESFGVSNNKNIVWTNVSSGQVCDYLNKFYFQKNISLSQRIKNLTKWIEEKTRKNELENWSVVLVSKEGSKTNLWGKPPFEIRMNNRSKIENPKHPEVIDIKTLSSPNDLLSDILVTDGGVSLKKRLNQYGNSNRSKFRKIRKENGREKTPLLLIYIIDKNSNVKKGAEMTRSPLNAKENLVGLFFMIPGEKNNGNFYDFLSIELDPELYEDLNTDMEE